MKISLLLFLVLTLFVVNCISGIPPNLPLCSAEDLECISKTITNVVQSHPNGWPEFNMPNLEPLRINSIAINQPEGAVALNLFFKNIDLSGLSKLKIERTVGFKSDPKASKFEFYGFIPKLTLVGDYKSKGKILILPIEGDGKCRIELEQTKVSVRIKPLLNVRNGKTYFTFEKIKLLLEPQNVKMQFDNLFGGDEALGKQMNTFLNENWRDIWKELGPSINEAFGEVLKALGTNMLKDVTYEDFYKNT